MGMTSGLNSSASMLAATPMKYHGNGNGNQLGFNACMLAPNPGKSRYAGE